MAYRKIKFCFLLSSFFLLSTSYSQANCVCCDEFHQQFDFWIGEWIVKDTAGNTVGQNSISKLEEGCIVAEHWRGTQGGTGTSHNYYDPSDSTWNQLWIDNKGQILKLKGNWIDNAMILSSDLVQGKNIKYYNRITWTPLSNGTVEQRWDIVSEKETLLNTIFLGIYYKQG